MERLDSVTGWPSTTMNDDFTHRSICYLAKAGYHDDAILTILTEDLGVEPDRAMRLVANARTAAVTLLRPHILRDSLARFAGQAVDDQLPPAA